MSLSLKISLLSLAVLLAACRSDPIHYHTLTPAQPTAGARGGADIQIERLTVPPQVDRPQIVIRQGSSGLAIMETEWWGANLSDELKSALVDQLSGTAAQHKVSLRVEVQRFDSIPGHYALVDAKWRLRTAETDASSTSPTCRTTLQTPAGPTIDDLVAAHQNNIKRLASLISKMASAPLNGCPTGE
ncbi:membrane integrity-associated transporter subunit PqiC [Pseudomonas sp. H3(2019)]|uniref:PqiC family protein n=1 Tax=Pseudomonas sp. H3(2019) TaxID=2598724 RepID=UPI001191D786|nr:PqiC family protein [Pseudomonas sp. H3(2019)]TVT79362.1 membrane integrity-associated transporter subunit PqiC [Pseudomonas sp. H3(2019)]